MSPPDQSALLRRKMEQTPGMASGPAPLSPDAACVRAVARAGFIAAGLKVAGPKVDVRNLDGVSALSDLLIEAAMVIPCAAPDGSEGFLALSSAGLTALVEKTTTGRIASAESEERAASTIDRLLCHAFLERFLEAWRELLSGSAAEAWLEGYRLEDRMVAPDVLSMSAADVPYRVHDVTAMFDSIRPVRFWVAMPETRLRPKSAGDAAQGARAVGDWAKDWRAAVLESPAELEAVLCRLELSLDEVRRWEPGDRVPIPATALSTVTLGRRNGPSVATARLGQARGVRALRLNEITAQRTPRATATSASPPAAIGTSVEGFEDASGIPTKALGAAPSAGGDAPPPSIGT